ncbi:MAG TPA: ATP-binding protein [Thermoanaerobaculia bacterium]|jgi:signal transduction histidine kinase
MPTARPLQRETRLLTGALIAFLTTLIVILLALALSILRLDRLSATADTAAGVVGPLAATASPGDLTSRLQLLRDSTDAARIEVYRNGQLYAASGRELDAAEVLTRSFPGGRMVLYFESWAGGRRAALVTGAFATIATMAGLLIFILYIPKFLRPVEEMLAQARQVNANVRGDDDARYLLDTFREAVARIEHQSQEIGHLREAASSRSPDVLQLARALNHSFSSGFLALDATGAVVAINAAGLQVLGLSEGAARSLDDLPAGFAAILRGSLEARTALTRREVLLENAGTLIGVSTIPLHEETFVGLFALFTDLTTFRAMEGRLRDLEALVGLGQLSAGIAHEFRNSLATILGYLQLAQRNAAPEQATRIRNAELEARSLAAAVDALLNFTKPLTLRSSRVRLDELTAAVMERFARTDERIAFSTDADGAVEINGDPELLERALENVIRNAADAVRERHPGGGGRIEATVRATPQPLITIRDNGIGLDAEQAESYLLPFQTGKASGTGLGLPLARKIVLHHGGTLNIEGVRGVGAVVRMEFFV